MRRKIEEYIEDVNKTEDVDGRTKRDWIFGAIDFCLTAKLISTDEYEDLLNKNGLI